MNPNGNGLFPTTRWSLIERIHSQDDAVASRAIEEICADYHYPLYCYLRRRGCTHHDAQDVLHDFLAKLVDQRALDRIDSYNGRLRGYLSTALNRHLARWQKARDGRDKPAPAGAMGVDFAAIEARYRNEAFSDADTPELIFERKWAIELLRHVLLRLEHHYHANHRGQVFDTLRPVLENGGTLRSEDTQALAARAGLSEPALRTALHRMLRRFREFLHEEVRPTVQSPEEIHDEIIQLMRLFQA